MNLTFLKSPSFRKWGRGLACLAFLIVVGCESPEEKVQSHYEDGLELFEEGNYVKAGLEYRNALQINGQYVPALYGMSLVEEKQGNLQGVRGFLIRVLDLDTKHLEANIRLGRLMLLGGRLDKALEYSDTAMDLDGANAGSLALKSAVLYKLDDKEGAVSAAKKALEADPGNNDAISVLAAERIAAGEVKEAIAYLDQGLALDEKNVTLQLIKIQALDSIQENDDAVNVLQQLIEFYPEQKGFKTALVRLYIRHDRLEEAERTVRAIAEELPDDLGANLDVVRFVNGLRGSEAGEKELNRLIEGGGPHVFPYQLALARLQFAAGKRDEPKQILIDVINDKKSEENKLEAQNRLAELLIAEGDTDAAFDLVNEVLTADTKNLDALIIRASLNVNVRKNTDAAIIDLRTVLKDKPDSIRALMMLGKAHELNGAIELADDKITNAFQISNASPNVGLVLVEFLVKNGSLERAENALIRVLIRNPRHIRSYRVLAQIRISRQNWIGAQEIADALEELGDDESLTSQIKGIALQGQAKFGQSIDAFEKAQLATPDSLRPMVALVRAYIRNDEKERAETFLQAVMESSEDNLFAQVLMSQLHALNGKPDLAEAGFKEAIEGTPDNALGYTSLAGFYIREGKPDAAQMVLSQGLEKIPGNVSLGLMRGNLLQTNSKFDEAIEEYEKLYALNPNSPIIINNLASMLTERSTDQATIERAYQMTKRFKNSNVPQFKDTLGWIHYRKGNIDEATDLISDATEQLPDFAIFRYHLGMVHLASKRTESAIEEFEKALELSKTQPLDQVEEVERLLKKLRSASD